MLAPGRPADRVLLGEPLTTWLFGPLLIVDRRLMLDVEGTRAAVVGVGVSAMLERYFGSVQRLQEVVQRRLIVIVAFVVVAGCVGRVDE